ncbi:TrbI/VirB10 family protein [Leptolyngbyaceae cyanobacterium UHCC 1019]
MNKHSTSEITSDSPELEEKSPKEDEWDELAELAAMTGYKPDFNKAARTATKPEPNQQGEESPLLDDEDLEEERETKTKTPLWSNPMAKGGVVSVLMAVAIGSVGLFVWSLNGNWNRNLNNPRPLASAPEATSKVDPEQAEIGRLKTVTALGSQAQVLKQAPRMGTRQMIPVKSGEKSKTVPIKSTPVRQFTSVPPAPVYSAPFRAFSPPTPVSVRSSDIGAIAAIPTPQVNPQEAWNKALALGSFGTEADTTSAFNEIPEPPIEQPTTQLATDTRYEADAAALLSGESRRVVAIVPGTTATGTLVTPIIWAQDLKPEQQPQRFGLQLTQPIYAADGSVALPAGTQMVAKVNAVSESGMVQLSVIAVVAPSVKGNQVVELPFGAIQIVGEAGKPLVAERQNPERGRLAGKDITVALLGALGQVGGLLNRLGNQTTTTSPYLSTTSISNGQTNILGGLLEGGFGKLADRVAQRQQQEIDQILKRPNLWYIPANRELTIFVSAPMEVAL